MNISYAILTHNENTELEKLLSILCTYKEYNDEIIIVDDYSDKLETIKLLEKQKKNITVYARHLENNFAKQKNFLNSCCNNE
ncbi:MAG: glycosyltransferase [Actinobacteria bacterium]|nr:glycosyltransferase [Actinomycetota bacterium]